MRSTIGLFVLDIDYPKSISSMTIPRLKDYASSIGAQFTCITERRFPNHPISYEKIQVYELGKDNDWNILIDCDMLIKEGMYNVVDLIPNGNCVGAWQSYWEPHLYNDRGIDIAIAANFLVVPNQCHNIFKPLDELEQPELWLKEMSKIDEFCLSLNRQKFGYRLVGIELPNSYNRLFKHLNILTDKVELSRAVSEGINFLKEESNEKSRVY